MKKRIGSLLLILALCFTLLPTAALASVPAAPTFCSADAILSRLLRSAASGTSRVDISSKEIVSTLLSSPFVLI